MKKIYPLLFFLFACGLTAVRAQDTSACNALFTWIPSGYTVYFYPADSAAGVRHVWNFGDSSTLSTTGTLVSHTYATAGTFTVTQVIIDSIRHCRDSSSQQVVIQASPPPPACGLTVTTIGDSLTGRYSFIANVTTPPGTTDTVTWTINGALAGYGDTLTKTFARDTAYNVCAALSTSQGCRIQSCVTINTDSVTTPLPPPDTCTISIGDVVNTHRSGEYTFYLADSLKYDSVQWTIKVFGPDSVNYGPFYGRSFTYIFKDTGNYWVGVRAVKAGCGWLTAGLSFWVDSVSNPGGPDSARSGSFISCYPNPATTQANLSVTMNGNDLITIRVYNSMGGQVLSTEQSGYTGVNQISLPIANLPTGIYYVQLQYGNTILRSKIQKL